MNKIIILLILVLISGCTKEEISLTPEGCVENDLRTYLELECVSRSGVMVWQKIKEINCSYYICELTEENQTELDIKTCGGYKDNYKAVCKDVERFETEYNYVNLTEKEISQIQTELISDIKPFYLYGIRKITFKKAKHGFYGGSYNPTNQTIRIDLYYIIGDIININTLCHEILHRYGLFNSEVMNDIGEKLPCY